MKFYHKFLISLLVIVIIESKNQICSSEPCKKQTAIQLFRQHEINKPRATLEELSDIIKHSETCFLVDLDVFITSHPRDTFNELLRDLDSAKYISGAKYNYIVFMLSIGSVLNHHIEFSSKEFNKLVFLEVNQRLSKYR